jgi:hypothetical protein
MTTTIARNIVGYRVESYAAATSEQETEIQAPALPVSHSVTEKTERPDMLIGSTYKIKTPLSDHALYVTINDIILNEGTPHETRRPFEVFVNTKNLDYYQWIVALTRIISSVFRKGGDLGFLVDELKAVFDPRGGYWKAGGIFMPSVIAEMGHVIGRHMESIGLLPPTALTDEQKRLIETKRQEYEDANKQTDAFATSMFPASAQMCSKCSVKSVILMDGCATCLSCADARCN